MPRGFSEANRVKLFLWFCFLSVKRNSRKLTKNLPNVAHSLFPVWKILPKEEHFPIVSCYVFYVLTQCGTFFSLDIFSFISVESLAFALASTTSIPTKG